MSEFHVAEFDADVPFFDIRDVANVLYVIQEGTVLLTDAAGAPVAEIHPGESFGEQALLKGDIHGAGAHAKTTVKCACITTERMVAYHSSCSSLLKPVLEGLLLELSMKNILQSQVQSIDRKEASH